MSLNSHKYNRYRVIFQKINSEKLKSGNGNFKNNSGRIFRVGNVFVAHGNGFEKDGTTKLGAKHKKKDK